MSDTLRKLETMCRSYAEDLDEIARGEVKKCADCDTRYTKRVSKNGAAAWKPDCGCAKRKGIKTEYTVADYVENDVYDVNYTIARDGGLIGVSLMVAGGGPNIYVDTNVKSVKGFWGGEEFEYPLSGRAVYVLEEEAEYMVAPLLAGGGWIR